ncbi:hypothetical protein THASP1DRAFT_32485 [Thamnocephalis sphaerospora]|uniref:Uncharacterized protein n=1 Tax=Thamnocephalis sphaerospora TaxID=78915 RepID=A0A4P9XIY4_9FUNG|nr:hypothetical protein THASP1DRAFT_32485 [Thamnocephalis sphaerospora]|eukprot:RKP05676.1 hypothetical protein THASP1DRAFT_32485 [Thamnocephalis sphaerospora]
MPMDKFKICRGITTPGPVTYLKRTFNISMKVTIRHKGPCQVLLYDPYMENGRLIAEMKDCVRDDPAEDWAVTVPDDIPGVPMVLRWLYNNTDSPNIKKQEHFENCADVNIIPAPSPVPVPDPAPAQAPIPVPSPAAVQNPAPVQNPVPTQYPELAQVSKPAPMPTAPSNTGTTSIVSSQSVSSNSAAVSSQSSPSNHVLKADVASGSSPVSPPLVSDVVATFTVPTVSNTTPCTISSMSVATAKHTLGTY